MLKALVAGVMAAQIAAVAKGLSTEEQAMVAPVAAAIAQVKAEQARLPPAKDDAERLLRMQALEQAPRKALMQIDFARIPVADRNKVVAAISGQLEPIDMANQKALLAMVPPEGWFTISRYGAPAANAAFLIVQHADVSLWRRFVPVLEPLVAKGEVKGQQYALMYDRLALADGRPQRYGSQMTCRGGRWVPDRLEDPEGVEARRAAIGMLPYADYLKSYEKFPPCG